MRGLAGRVDVVPAYGVDEAQQIVVPEGCRAGHNLLEAHELQLQQTLQLVLRVVVLRDVQAVLTYGVQKLSKKILLLVRLFSCCKMKLVLELEHCVSEHELDSRVSPNSIREHE